MTSMPISVLVMYQFLIGTIYSRFTNTNPCEFCMYQFLIGTIYSRQGKEVKKVNVRKYQFLIGTIYSCACRGQGTLA